MSKINYVVVSTDLFETNNVIQLLVKKNIVNAVRLGGGGYIYIITRYGVNKATLRKIVRKVEA